MSDLRSAVAAAAFNEGWTCTAHEPEGNWDDCPDCREALTNLSGAVASITLDAAREAVAALDIAYDERQNDLPVVSRGQALAAIDALITTPDVTEIGNGWTTDTPHDHLCPWGSDGDPDQCYLIEGLDSPMTVCELIAKVRKDERKHNGCDEAGFAEGYSAGYSDAVKDSVAEVEGVVWFSTIDTSDFVKAIKKLGGR